MDVSGLRTPLTQDEIEFRVQSINRGGYATMLVYKNARVDMEVLDRVVGPTNWKREHLNGNHNCIVSIWCPDKKAWVSKEDTGTESNQDAQKGLASDSFKRACTNWGIGRELYDYPEISVKLNDNEWEIFNNKPKATWNLKVKNWRWFTKWENNKLVLLAARDETGAVRFKYKVEGEAPSE